MILFFLLLVGLVSAQAGLAPIQNAPIRSVQIQSTSGLGGLPEATRHQILNSVSSYAKIDPATGFRAVVTIPNSMQANQNVRDMMLTKLTSCVKKITGFYGLPLPPRFEIRFYDVSAGPRPQVPWNGALQLWFAITDSDAYFAESGFNRRPDCFVSTHEMAHALGPHDKGILEEGYATFTQWMVGPRPDAGVVICAEEGYCTDVGSEYYLLPYSLVHPTQVNGETYGGSTYSTGLCAWAYIDSKFGRNKLRQIIDGFESTDCEYGDCISDFILPVLKERNTRLFEQKFDLTRSDNDISSSYLQPIRRVDSCSDVRSAAWWRKELMLPIQGIRPGAVQAVDPSLLSSRRPSWFLG